jgi:hypothetical protein
MVGLIALIGVLFKLILSKGSENKKSKNCEKEADKQK